MIGEVFLRAAVTVHEEQTGTRAPYLDVELDTVVGPYPHFPPRSMSPWSPREAPRATFAARFDHRRFRRLPSVPVSQPPVPAPTEPAESPQPEPTLAAILPEVARRSGRWKVALRLVVSVGVLAILVIKTPQPRRRGTPPEPHAHRDPAGPRAAPHDRRHRAVGVALAAGAPRVRPARRPGDAHVVHARGPVRRQRAAVDDRRRRGAHQPARRAGSSRPRPRSRRLRSSGSRGSSRSRRSSSSGSSPGPRWSTRRTRSSRS